jgi:hypothetical protein
MKKLIIMTLFLLAFFSCSNSDDNDCSSSDNCSDDPISTPVSNVKLKLDFVDSTFYDAEKSQFRDLTVSNIKEGNLGERLPVYVDFLSLSTSEALNKIEMSILQRDNKSAFAEEDLNKIPYFALRYKNDENIIYEYRKYTETGAEVASHNGILIKSGDMAYLPIINEMFDNKFFDASAGGSQSNFTHQLRFAAQTANSTDSEIVRINFNANLIVPNKDFNIEYSDDMKNINLDNRWRYFYDGSDGAANTDLVIADLVEKTDTETSANLDNKDVRVVFKSRPKVEMVYSLFDEENLVKDSTAIDSSISVIRSYKFFEKTYILDSENDFGLVFKINGTDVALTDGINVTNTSADKEGVLRDIGAGIPWRFSFGYDLTQKASYPSGKTLLKPLRPFCNSITKTPFLPITQGDFKSQVNNLGGFAALCHPDTLQVESVSSENLATYPNDTTDTFYSYFSYMPTKEISSDSQHVRIRSGHFYGIKSIVFRVEGCLKLYIRDASLAETNPNPWVQKNNETESCSSGAGDTGWLAYSINKEISIFDNPDQYSDIPGLKEIINNFRNSVPESSVNFYFNDDDFVNHIH